jgi:hypothetical protein
MRGRVTFAAVRLATSPTCPASSRSVSASAEPTSPSAGRAASAGDDRVVLGEDVQVRAGDRGEVDRLAAEPQRAVHERVAADEVVDDLGEHAAGERHVVAGPLRHGLVALDVAVVPQVLPERRVLRDLRGRAQQAERVLDRLGRDVARRVDELVGVQAALADHPGDRAHRPEVDRRGHRDQVAHRQVGVAREREQAEHAAEAVAEDR